MTDLFLRVFVEAGSESEARAVASRLCEVLAVVCASVHIGVVRPYWKITGYQEATFRLQFAGEPGDGLAAIVASLGAGWTRQQADREAIWDSKTASGFVEPEVRWAHLEVGE